METELVEELLTILEALQSVTDNTDELEGNMAAIEGNMAAIEESVAAIEEQITAPQLLLETPIDEYTVTEGLLLTIVICMFLKSLWRLVKEGFYWLM